MSQAVAFTENPVWLGQQIRELRKLRKISLTDLQQITGRSLGFLSQLERGKSQASVTDLSRIATALGVPFSVFFQQGAEEEQGVVRREANRPLLQYADGVTDALLSPGFGSSVQLILTTFAPGAHSGSQPFAHGGDEAGMVLTGQLQLTINGVVHLLNAGDSFCYPSNQPHLYSNPGNTPTQVVWAYSTQSNKGE
ncbi:XRE family transcriptional regulator [Leeia sp. TBRC 13508]|uniref:XRE family transcriptional regulator n=1 Tax=Leeia speluncae TaxID=2884804 RepID=A0ABS8D4D1_9NEIS|nr:XRE family transcriptional regulator [Leeia speluncae]MCB6183076.1 XRE family transcriptional regulator [Leeia speluncae]